jgi:hypothetical protein
MERKIFYIKGELYKGKEISLLKESNVITRNQNHQILNTNKSLL